MVFHQIHDLLLGQERGLDVDLGEFGLAVGAQVLVAEAFDDLVVAVEARHHQQLLEQLRRLRQGEKMAGMNARRHQIVARAFRRGAGQHRRFHLHEALLVEGIAQGLGHLVAQPHVLLHRRAAQVEVTVRQAHGFAQVLVVQLERDGSPTR